MIVSSKNSFSKEERLKSSKIINHLFSRGHSVTEPPLKALWMPCELSGDYPAQVGFAVPKRGFSKAVDRNKIKRRLRESYRQNKRSFYEQLVAKNSQIALMVIFLGKKLSLYQEIDEKLALTLKGIIKDL